jgi:hypothetical protein
MIRRAISPRLAISILENIRGYPVFILYFWLIVECLVSVGTDSTSTSGFWFD